MNKAELITAVSEKTDLRKNFLEDALSNFLDVISDELKDGGKVQLIGFGTFEVSDRAARTGKNPQTGEPIDIPACKTVKFKPGKALKDAVNK